MYRIITVDLDGTLLSPENKITKYTKKIIKLLINKGFYIIFASGRHHIDMMHIRDHFNIRIFMITSNGAKVYNLDNKLIFESNLDTDIALKLSCLKYLDLDIITQVYQNNQWYINNSKIQNNFCPSLSSLKYEYFHPDTFNFSEVSKIFYTSNNFQKLCELKKHIITLLGKKVNISFSVPGCLEVISGKTSKGYGLQLISNMLGISLQECITFGDGMNDYDMLNISGKACIMENADSRLKDALPYAEIIGNNKHDGVAVYLNKMFIKFDN
ncbi:Cof-type HAD-IIB family hydrolase [Buchnera aphidicola (Aphis helianthi)]|uniref:Cof-type HAD-IIB family hydrolase n=1 Tax=Buchnera aphidicola (Aphis helianthi) TaxID=2315802 RepID=A0A4D6XP62_9GAMM|nr:Cof-type HAD-IIB family hydrolase [Buchnera aphidicola]QCI16874.1 Cof-type HAD-IIB family hydrolase [Buchnera aphidicola (Aphis helianthi)]